MNGIRDFEYYEVKNLLRLGPLEGKQALEIGCGAGWLARQYASTAKRVIGIDPTLEELQQAKVDQPAAINNMFILQAKAESMPFAAGSFDLVLLANSL